MSDCSKQIRSFVLGIIAWGIVTIILKMMKKSEAFTLGDEAYDTTGSLGINWNLFDFNDVTGEKGATIPKWGSGGTHGSRIDNGSELDSAKDLLDKIGASTDDALTEIQTALNTYKAKRKWATDDIGSRIDEDRQHAQEMITALDKALHDAGKQVRDRRTAIREIAQKIHDMSSDGAVIWDDIRDQLHTTDTHTTAAHQTPGTQPDRPATTTAFTQPPREGFRQKRKYSKRVPSPTIAGTSLGN
jgi:ABC-type transporter Mla subunit MlaD